MDLFIEKIVARRKTPQDYMIILGIVIAVLIIILFAGTVPVVKSFTPLVAVGAIYLAYRIIISRNIEFEYIVTNGDLDIDKIIAQRKRKRVFSSNCKEFDVVARLKTNRDKAGPIHNVQKKIEAVTSMNSDDIYFVLLNHKGERTVVYFEPDERMLKSFKKYIPRKVFE